MPRQPKTSLPVLAIVSGVQVIDGTDVLFAKAQDLASIQAEIAAHEADTGRKPVLVVV